MQSLIGKMMGDFDVGEVVNMLQEGMDRLERLENRMEFLITVLSKTHPKEFKETIETFKETRRKFFYLEEQSNGEPGPGKTNGD